MKCDDFFTLQGEKRFPLNYRLTDQHLDVKIKNIVLCLSKSFQAKITIAGNATSQNEQVSEQSLYW